jgi:3-dehydroquinate dehydratase/shikimate dehydrogenase
MPIFVCESVQGRSLAEVIQARDAVSAADLVELRLDGVPDARPAAALAGSRLPAIVTCRPVWEGGRYDGEEAARVRLLEEALQAGAAFVDLEWNAPGRAAFLQQWAPRTVLSWHDHAGTPADLPALAEAMLSAGAAVTKIAVTTRCLRDLAPLLALGRRLPPGRSVVLIGMGPAGIATRVLPQRFGSCWTYAGNGVAPGQVPARRLVQEFRVRETTASTAVFGLAGRPVGHSLSPAIHNAAFAACRVDAVFLGLEASDFDDFLWAAEALGLSGASVTAPFKRDAAATAAVRDATVEALGVANTLRREPDGSWAARNTDVEGFLRPLAGVPLAGTRVSVLGAGGAARAVVAALAGRGASVTVHARRPEAAQEVADRFGAAIGSWPPVPGSWQVLVNTTPVGTYPRAGELPIPASIVRGGTVYDLVYNPPDTALIEAAAANGCRTIGGLAMLVGQAARQFEWWTGHDAPSQVMDAAARRALQEFRLGDRAGHTGR